jgi:DNA-binding phage protein
MARNHEMTTMMTATKPQTAASVKPPHLRTGTQRARLDNYPEPSDALRFIAPEPGADDFPELSAALASGDSRCVITALYNAVSVYGTAQVAARVGMTIAGLDALKHQGSAAFESVRRVLDALGGRLALMRGGRVVSLADGGSGDVCRIVCVAALDRGARVVARAAGCKSFNFEKCLAGDSTPRLKTLMRIVAALGCRLDVLPREAVEGDGWTPLVPARARRRDIGGKTRVESRNRNRRPTLSGALGSTTPETGVGDFYKWRRRPELEDVIRFTELAAGEDDFRELNAALASGDDDAVLTALRNAVADMEIWDATVRYGSPENLIAYLEKRERAGVAVVQRIADAAGHRLVVTRDGLVASLREDGSWEAVAVLANMVRCQGVSEVARKAGMGEASLRVLVGRRTTIQVGCVRAVVPKDMR